MDQFSVFGQIIGFGGGATVLLAFMTGSVIPLIIGVIGIFCVLAFMNGLDTTPAMQPVTKRGKR